MDREKPKITEVTLTGRFDAAHYAQKFNQLVNSLGDRPQLLLLNLEALDFIDSKGLSGIILAHNQLKAWQGKIAVLCPSGQVKELFDLTNVSRLVKIYNSREDCDLAIATSKSHECD